MRRNTMNQQIRAIGLAAIAEVISFGAAYIGLPGNATAALIATIGCFLGWTFCVLAIGEKKQK